MQICPTGWYGRFPECKLCDCDHNKGFVEQCDKETGKCRCKVNEAKNKYYSDHLIIYFECYVILKNFFVLDWFFHKKWSLCSVWMRLWFTASVLFSSWPVSLHRQCDRAQMWPMSQSSWIAWSKISNMQDYKQSMSIQYRKWYSVANNYSRSSCETSIKYAIKYIFC